MTDLPLAPPKMPSDCFGTGTMKMFARPAPAALEVQMLHCKSKHMEKEAPFSVQQFPTVRLYLLFWEFPIILQT